MSSEARFVSGLAIVGLFLLAYVARLQFKTWLAPSALFGLYWVLAIFFPLIFFPNLYFWPGAAWFIFLTVLCLHVGAQLGWAAGWVKEAGKIKRMFSLLGYDLAFGKQVFFFCAAMGVLSIFVTIHSRGYVLFEPRSLEVVEEISRGLIVARYGESYAPPLAARLLMAFVYLGAIFAGIWIRVKKSLRERLWAVLPFLPASATAVLQTTRSSLLYPLIFAVGGYCAFSVMTRNIDRVKPKFWKNLAYTTSIVFAVVLLSVGLEVLRAGPDSASLSLAAEKMRVVLFASPSAFSKWFEENLDLDEPTWGKNTFAGMFEYMGMIERQPGIYTDRVDVSQQGESTNVFTLFRGLIEDFTLPGSLLMMFLLGIIAGFSYRRVSLGSIAYVPILAGFYSLVFWSGVISIFNYNTVVLTYLVFYICLSPFGLHLLRERR